MKNVKTYLQLLVVFVIAFFSITSTTQAQPALNMVLMPSSINVISDNSYFKIIGKCSGGSGYDFDSVFHHSYDGAEIFRDNHQKGSEIALFVDSFSNISIAANKDLKSRTFAYLMKVYSPKRAREIMRDFYGYKIKKNSITDVITSGSIYMGNKNNARLQKYEITGGKIVITYNSKTDKMKFSFKKVKIRKESENTDQPLTVSNFK